MSKQLSFEGFPQQAHRELYTAPPTLPTAITQRRLWEPIEQMISINPDYFTLFNDISGIRKNRKLLASVPVNNVKRISDIGTLSRGAYSRMKRALNYLSLISQVKQVKNVAKNYSFTFKTSFITLTLSDVQQHSDNYIKEKMLKRFIDAIRKRYPAISYVWKSETQKNGRIHFHIITDHFIPTAYINNRWNKIQWDHGYLNKYMTKKGHMYAPSCEIRKVKDDEGLQKYMRKYMLKGLEKLTPAELNAKIDSLKNRIAFESSVSKREEMGKELIILYRRLNEATKRKVTGKLWGCSDNLLLRPYKTLVNSLSFEDRQMLFENEVLVDSQYFQVFKLIDFRNFIKRFSNYTKSFIVTYYKQLIHPIPIPQMVYSTDSNYTYS